MIENAFNKPLQCYGSRYKGKTRFLLVKRLLYMTHRVCKKNLSGSRVIVDLKFINSIT